MTRLLLINDMCRPSPGGFFHALSELVSIRIMVNQRARRNWTPFMNTFYISCPLLSMRKTWTSSAQTF